MVSAVKNYSNNILSSEILIFAELQRMYQKRWPSWILTISCLSFSLVSHVDRFMFQLETWNFLQTAKNRAKHWAYGFSAHYWRYYAERYRTCVLILLCRVLYHAHYCGIWIPLHHSLPPAQLRKGDFHGTVLADVVRERAWTFLH